MTICKLKVGDQITWSEELISVWHKDWDLIKDTFTIIKVETGKLYLDKAYCNSHWFNQKEFIYSSVQDGMPLWNGIKTFKIVRQPSNNTSCPLCGSSANILFTSVECINPECRNHK